MTTNKPEATDLHPDKKGPKPETEAKYREALELYRTTDMTVEAICARTKSSVRGFRSYIHRFHRDLLLARHNLKASPEEASEIRLNKGVGQRASTHAKYREAIEACDSMEYIEFNVSEIARMFHLSPSALANQLRSHYPDIQERRERERSRSGIYDNHHRGVTPGTERQYAEATEHLRESEDTIRQTAELYGVSYSGLREHLLYYHKDLILRRADRRKKAVHDKRPGEINGGGGRHAPSPESVDKYSEAVLLYSTTALTYNEVAEATGVTPQGLRYHLRMWHPDIIAKRHDVDGRGTESNRKRYLKSTSQKYYAAIERMKATGETVVKVAAEFGLNPDTFRQYLHEHEPELAASHGMTQLDNGKKVSARSAARYEEALRLYETTTETLKSIASRLGLNYKSVGGYLRRNRPDIIAAHRRLLP